MNRFLKSILAGICIAIGAMSYMNLGGGIAGAFCFSIGLIMVFQLGLPLYTGVVAKSLDSKAAMNTTEIALIGNIIGCCIMLLLPNEAAKNIVAAKTASFGFQTFIKAVICGVIIYSATLNKTNILSTIMHVAGFILCGAEHSIAFACYLLSARDLSYLAVSYLLVVIAGNAVGGIAAYHISKEAT